MCEWIVAELGSEVPIHFSAFHPDYKMFDWPTHLDHDPCWPRMRSPRKPGFIMVYTGNIDHPPTQSTYCPYCGGAVDRADRLSDQPLRARRKSMQRVSSP